MEFLNRVLVVPLLQLQPGDKAQDYEPRGFSDTHHAQKDRNPAGNNPLDIPVTIQTSLIGDCQTDYRTSQTASALPPTRRSHRLNLPDHQDHPRNQRLNRDQ